MIFRHALGLLAAIVLLSATALAVHAAEPAAKPAHKPNPIDFSMWFNSDIRDTPECALAYDGGRFDFGAAITNPAASCPDSFAWKLFAQSVQQKFWEDWTTDRQAWPSDPWPRCAPGGGQEKCCPALANSNGVWPEHCPVFPGATPGAPSHVVGRPSKAHQISFADAAGTDRNNDGMIDWKDVPDNLKAPVIGDLQNELVYRNEPMMKYLFDRQMYHVEGLKAIYQAHQRALGAYAPYHPKVLDPVRQYKRPRTPSTVVFPIQSVMIKANWIDVDLAPKIGIDPYDKDNPYIIMDLVPKADDDAPTSAPVATKPFVLLSFHISTKDLPNWFWATFEHAGNQGRCDWLGCNDSFGYVTSQKIAFDASKAGGLEGPAPNYIPPHQLKNADGSTVGAFALAKPYTGTEAISKPLASLLKDAGIATASTGNRSGRPTPRDAAWRSYRLKGSQIDFVSLTGRPTLLGNSVTEAGFVNNASCISCHARSGVDKDGLAPLDIFINHLSNAGIEKSNSGSPIEAWFYVNGYYGVNGERQSTAVRAVPTDFVFGVRNACPMKESTIGPAWCKNVKP